MARLAYTSILVALVATCAAGQAQQQGGGSAAQIMSSIPSDSVTITHWYKQNVYDPNDSKIGEIMDVLVDREGKATALIVGVGGFLGMGEKDVAVPFNSVRAHQGQQQVLPRDELHEGRAQKRKRIQVRPQCDDLAPGKFPRDHGFSCRSSAAPVANLLT